MKKILIFLGKNTIPTIAICIVTLAVFATSVYGFVKVANLNSPMNDIPEVEGIQITESSTSTPIPTPSLSPEDNQEELSDFPEPSVSPTPSVTPTVTGGKSEDKRYSTEARRRVKRNSRIEVDNELENVHEDSDQQRPESSERLDK